MFNKHTTTLLAATLLPLASAYQLTFYAGFDCNGERLETRQADQDGTCYDAEYLGGNTNSVNIIKEVGDDPNSIVAFYPRDVDCRPGDSISAGNTGCVNVYQDDQFFGGYNVISGEFKSVGKENVSGSIVVSGVDNLGLLFPDSLFGGATS